MKELNEPDIEYGRYTYADYLKWTFAEQVELIKGKIFKMSPAPKLIHQGVSWQVSGLLYTYLKNKNCKAFSAPFDVRLPAKSNKDEDIETVVQPDICVICDLSKLDQAGCIGAPDLIIEILSKSNSKKDLQNKYEVYEESGVKEYWIIHPEVKTILILTLLDNHFQPSRLFTLGDKITSSILPGFELRLNDIFENEK